MTSYHIEADGRSIELGPDARSYVLTGLNAFTHYALVNLYLIQSR